MTKIITPEILAPDDLRIELGIDDRIINQYFGVWAIEPSRFKEQTAGFNHQMILSHMASQKITIETIEPKANSGEGKPFQVSGQAGNVAVIPIKGTILKYGSSFGGASTIRIQRMLSAADADSDIKGAVLHVDSPGGTIAGVQAAAESAFKFSKPLATYYEDLGASAAVWIGSQSNRSFAANASTMVGSIGVYSVVYDYSKAAEDSGIKVHLITTGEYKGAGVPGTEITEAQLEYFQGIVNSLDEIFRNGVAKGRDVKLSMVNEWADGRVHPAETALDIGLIDEIGSFGNAVSWVESQFPSSSVTSKRIVMTTDTVATDQPATLSELKAACPGADSDFYIQQMDAEATEKSAMRAFNTLIQKQLADAQNASSEKNEEKKTEKAASDKISSDFQTANGSGKSGSGGDSATQPLSIEGGRSASSADDKDSSQPYLDCVDDAVKRGIDRQQANRAAQRKYPKSHLKYLYETNDSANGRRWLDGKFNV